MRDTARLHRVSALMKEQGREMKWLIDETGIGDRIVNAIYHQRYTPSPLQRLRVAEALHVDREQIMWGHVAYVDALKEPV